MNCSELAFKLYNMFYGQGGNIMAIARISFEGDAEVNVNQIICVCGHCNNHDNTSAIIELNFREQKLIYQCSECGKKNEMAFGQEPLSPLPRSSFGR